MAERDLENHLRKLITKHKYLVVIDDMWQREAWKSLKRAFSDSNNASRVIITTRKVGVAERADNRGFVHELCFLRQEESWELFCRKLVDVRAMIPAMVSSYATLAKTAESKKSLNLNINKTHFRHRSLKV
nr:disease resistance protein RPP13-like [Solanum lycopersicum]